MPAPDERFIAALRAEAQGAARLTLDGIQRAFSAAFPHLDGAPNRRARLAAMLDTLLAGNIIRLPADRKRGWQNRPLPALPLRIGQTLICQIQLRSLRRPFQLLERIVCDKTCTPNHDG